MAGVAFLYFRIAPELPEVDSLADVQLQMPLRVYTADGDLIAEYGEKRREPVLISQVPDSLKNAIIASEDARFYEHPGVDYRGILRALINLIRTGEKGQGGSTLTMQVARNFFLSNEKTYDRKLREIFLSFKIEHTLAKDQILELYVNKIYLGNRSYGFAAASKVYYGKELADINVAEAAMLAGLPKAPSRFNPIVNPERALIRRNYVLGRLHALKMIDTPTYQRSLAMADTATLHFARPEAEAHYVGEMARARVKQLYGDDWSTNGFNVYTTIRSADQQAANQAVRGGLFDYERRHGWRGPLARLEPEALEDEAALYDTLESEPDFGGLIPAVILESTPEFANALTIEGERVELPLAVVDWARKRINVDTLGEEITAVDAVLAPGDVVHLQRKPDGVIWLAQSPSVEGALVSMEPRTGAILALVGGFDYFRSKFNRVTQAQRQPGSTFKPFIYSAALAHGDTAATIYNDAPVVFHDAALEGEWRPSNYSGRFFGPTRLREALVKSRNLVSVRVLREIGIPYAIDYATRFGFGRKKMPRDLSLSLGSATLTPMQLTTGFSVFANGGYKVQPHFIDRIVDSRGVTQYSTPKVVLCDDCGDMVINPLEAEMEAEQVADTEKVSEAEREKERKAAAVDVVDAPRVIDARNAFIMTSMMRDVVRRGTARKVGARLGRKDLGGKTGTTNNQLDAWFAGFSPDIAAAAWIGSDGLDPLGRGEAGGVAAAPVWASYMGEVLKGVPEAEAIEPPGIETVRIDITTGEPATGKNTMLEYFMEETVPEDALTVSDEQAGTAGNDDKVVKKSVQEKAKEVDQLF